MRKHTFLPALFAVFVLFCLLLPQKAEAATACPDFTFTSISGKTVTKSNTAGKVRLIIFFRTTCLNSKVTIENLSNAYWVNHPNLSIIAAEMDGASTDKVKEFAKTYGNNGKDITFCTGGNEMWTFLRAAGYNENSMVLPACFFIDAKNNIQAYTTAYQDPATIRNKLKNYISFPTYPVTVTSNNHSAKANELLTLINTERAKKGLAAFTLDTSVQSAAMQRVAECSVLFSHTRPNGQNYLTLSGFTGTQRTECISAGSIHASEVLAEWMASANDKKALLSSSSYKSAGIMVVEHGGCYYWLLLLSSNTPTKTTVTTAKTVTANVALEDPTCLDVDTGKTVYTSDKIVITPFVVNTGVYVGTDLSPSCLTFTALDPKVATISSTGAITPLKAGTARFQVALSSGYSLGTVTYTFRTKLTIHTHPVSVSVPKGQVATVKVGAEGDGLIYQWYYKNYGSTQYALTTTFTGNTYSVTMTPERDGRMVYCRVSDQYGNLIQSKSVRLTIDYYANILKQPVSVCVPNGKAAKVSFTASGEGLTYKWYYKNANESTFTYTPTFTGNTYQAPMSDERAGRSIYCIVTDRYGHFVKTDTVVLYQAVKLTRQPTSVVIPAGSLASTKVLATGKGLTYKWFVKDPGKSFVRSSITSNTYSYTMTAAKSGRQIYCVVTDSFGNSVTSKTVTMHMGNPLKLTRQPVSVKVANGKNLTVSFTASGDGLTYKWYYKNKGETKFTYTSTFKANTYTTVMTAARNARQIYCVVTDKYGQTVKTNTVTISMTSAAK